MRTLIWCGKDAHKTHTPFSSKAGKSCHFSVGRCCTFSCCHLPYFKLLLLLLFLLLLLRTPSAAPNNAAGIGATAFDAMALTPAVANGPILLLMTFMRLQL
jgi:hypothetical protein